MMDRLFDILTHFTTEGEVNSIVPFGSGHINDSYLVTTSPAEAPDYVLQRINHHIFSNIPQLTGNIQLVTEHVSRKIRNLPGQFPGFEIFQMVPTCDQKYFFRDEMGSYWRVLNCIRNGKSHDMAGSPELARQAGRAFGIFHVLTADIDPNTLYEILPDFHNIRSRLAMFREKVKNDPAGRVSETMPEITFIENRVEEMHYIFRLGLDGKIPLRITHNDTKINNVIFNSRNEAISVVDLDTVMPGFILYDFGDAIRTGACTAAEDEADLQLIDLDLSLFEAYAQGYLEIAHRFLKESEIENLAFSAKFMTYLIGLRFLTDHLDGDRYYKIRFPGHNLQRARAQFHLLQCMEDKFGIMDEIIRKISGL